MILLINNLMEHAARMNVMLLVGNKEEGEGNDKAL